MPRYASLAEQYRAHREAFLLAQELGITPRMAEQLLRDRARARRRACGTRAPDAPGESDLEPMDSNAAADFSDWGAGWMMRD